MKRSDERIASLDRGVRKLVMGVILGFGVGSASYFAVWTIFTDSETKENAPSQSASTVGSDQLDSIDSLRLVDLLTEESSNLTVEDLLAQFNELTTMQIKDTTDVTQLLLIGELAHVSPSQALEKVWVFPSTRWNDLVTVVFKEWSVGNLEDAMQAVRNLVGPLREVAMQAILDEQHDQSLTTFLDLAQRFGLQRLANRLVNETEAREQLTRPKDAWNLIVDRTSLRGLDQHKNILVEIAKTWIQRDGIDIIANLYDDLYPDKQFLFRQILLAITKDEPQKAFDWVVDSSVAIQDATAASLLATWARQDPESAYRAASRLAKHSTRGAAIRSVISVWAERNPRNLLQHIPTLPKNIRNSAVNNAVRELARIDPKEAVKIIDQLDPLQGAVNDWTLSDLVRSWSESDPIGALEWIKDTTVDGSHRATILIREILLNYALSNPNEAMSIALSTASTTLYLETDVIRRVSERGEVDQAIELLDRVRDGARLWSYVSVGRHLITSNRTEEAYALARRLSDDEQEDYFTAIVYAWQADSLLDLLDWLPKLPSAQVKSAVAQQTLYLYGTDGLFGSRLSQSQNQHLQTFLDDESAQKSSNKQ